MRLPRAQSRTQFSVWAVLMAPLLLGAPVAEMDAFDLETYGNEEVLAVSQDGLARQGGELRRDGSHVVWGRELADGSWVLVFENDDWLWGADVVCDTPCWSALPFARGAALQVMGPLGQNNYGATCKQNTRRGTNVPPSPKREIRQGGSRQYITLK